MTRHPSPVRTKSRGTLHVALWVAQVLLFVVFAITGTLKVTAPIAQLAPIMSWVTEVPAALVRLIGVVELAGALGVLLPALTRVRPELTSLAALGLTLTMVGATVVNLARGEASHVAVSLSVGVLAAFVAWGRYARVPIAPRRAPRGASASRLARAA